MNVKIKKGMLNNSRRYIIGYTYNQLKINFKNRNLSSEKRKEVMELILELKKMRNDYQVYMEGLPTKFGPSYDGADYFLDIQNIKMYYSRWKKEDLWKTKESLSRARKFEKREKLEPFEILEHIKNVDERKKKIQLQNDREEQNYYLRKLS